MDKPISMSVKDYLIKTMSVRTKIPSSTIDCVIKSQFENIIEAMQDNRSIEISGFGKFLFNVKKSEKRIVEELKRQEIWGAALLIETSELKRKTLSNSIESSKGIVEFIKKKL